jgi:hypothetical protein
VWGWQAWHPVPVVAKHNRGCLSITYFAVCPQTPRDVTACLSRVESFRSKTPTHDSEARRRPTTPKQDANARLQSKTPTHESEARRQRTTPKQDVLETWRAAESFLVDRSSFCRDHRDQTNAHNYVIAIWIVALQAYQTHLFLGGERRLGQSAIHAPGTAQHPRTPIEAAPIFPLLPPATQLVRARRPTINSGFRRL